MNTEAVLMNKRIIVIFNEHFFFYYIISYKKAVKACTQLKNYKFVLFLLEKNDGGEGNC